MESAANKVVWMIRTTMFGLGLVVVILLSGGASVGSAQAAAKPNILFILTNDQHTAMLKHMPNVQARLKATGVEFENTINTYPLCCPSRATIQRGQYAHNTRIFGNSVDMGGGYPTFDKYDLEKSTVATWLNDAGYRTAHVGSYMNQYIDGTTPPPGWDYFGAKNPNVKDFETIDAARSQDAMTQLKLAASGLDPFYLQVGFQSSHVENNFESRYAKAFEGERVPRMPAYNEKNVRDKPPYIRDTKPRLGQQKNMSVSPSCKDNETNSIQQNDCEWVRALRSLQTVDAFVANALSLLEEQGELANTYVFFYTDNGNHWGEHRLDAGKLTPYETDIAFPLLVRGPGVPQGVASKKLVGNHDLAPTFAAIGGARSPDFVDGTSFLRLLDQNSANNLPWRRAVFVEREWRKGWTVPKKEYEYYVPPYEAVRRPNSIYVRYADNPWTTKRDGFQEYYDLAKDPYELRNSVFYDTVTSRKLDKEKKLLTNLRTCRAEGCRVAEGFPAP